MIPCIEQELCCRFVRCNYPILKSPHEHVFLCRSLQMQGSHLSFMKLAPADLKELVLYPNISEYWEWEPYPLERKPDIASVVAIVGLRKLELRNFPHLSSLEPLSSLKLEGFSLVECCGARWPDIRGADFPHLQKLHIEDSKCSDEWGMPGLARYLDEFGGKLVSMKTLVQLSGNGLILESARMGGLQPNFQLSASYQHATHKTYLWLRCAQRPNVDPMQKDYLPANCSD